VLKSFCADETISGCEIRIDTLSIPTREETKIIIKLVYKMVYYLVLIETGKESFVLSIRQYP